MSSATQQYSRHVSVPSDQGLKVEKTLTITRPPAEVYAFWRRLENLSRFMRHVESVTEHDDLHSHWAVKTLGGKVFEWDAEIIEQRENEMISWRSTPGADVDNAGSVWFAPVHNGTGTFVRVELKYVPPAGRAGALLAKAFGRDAEAEIEEDLNRLKALLETGQLPEDPPAWQRAMDKARQATSVAQEAVRENPWRVVAWSAAIGFVIGWVLTRPRRRQD